MCFSLQESCCGSSHCHARSGVYCVCWAFLAVCCSTLSFSVWHCQTIHKTSGTQSRGMSSEKFMVGHYRASETSCWFQMEAESKYVSNGYICHVCFVWIMQVMSCNGHKWMCYAHHALWYTKYTVVMRVLWYMVFWSHAISAIFAL